MLIEALTDRSDWVRYVAVFALGRNGEQAAAATPKLLSLVNDRNVEIRFAVVRTLKSVAPRDSSIIPVLVEALEDNELAGPALVEGTSPNRYQCVRGAVAQALGEMGSAATIAVEPLRALIEATYSEPEEFCVFSARLQASVAVWRITSSVDEVLPVLVEHLELLIKPQSRRHVHLTTILTAIGEMGSAAGEAAPAVRRVLREYEKSVSPQRLKLSILAKKTLSQIQTTPLE